MSKTPKVSLISHSPDPIGLLCYFRRVTHSPVPNSIEELLLEPVKFLDMTIDEYVERVLEKDKMPTFLEAVSLTFKLENVSRALTHQLVRHRIGFSYSQQSMRCVNVPNFAGEGGYAMPPGLTHPQQVEFHYAMKTIQELYGSALEFGIPTQDARGLLPTNIQTTIVFTCNLRALIGMVNKRLCLKTQEEFHSVAEQILEHVKNIDPRLLHWVGKPCDFGRCLMGSENAEQLRAGQLKGEQNTDHVCPIYMEKFAK